MLCLVGCSNNPNRTEWEREDTLFYAMGTEPVSFDPSVSYNAADAPIMDLVYPQYFRFNYLKQNPWELELNLGLTQPTRTPVTGKMNTDKGEVTYHGERWTFELRHDIRFQDDPCFPGGVGRQVTAKDMEYAIKRMADPDVQFPLTANLQDKLLGWNDYLAGFKKDKVANYNRPLEGVQLDPSNPYRFSVIFTVPYPQWRYLMAMHFTTPIPREAVEKYGDAFALQHPVGCGPFKFEEYAPQWQVVLVRNPSNTFWTYPTDKGPTAPSSLLADAGKPIPLVKRVVFRIVAETVTSYNLFDEGYLDAYGVSGANAQFVLPAVRPGAKMVARGVKLMQGAYPSVNFCGFNMKDPTFGGYTPEKRKLRQAISLSIDSGAYIDLISQGLAKKSEFILASGLCGFDPDYENPYRQYDPHLTKAKQLLADAGYPGGIDKKTGERLVLTLDNITVSPADRIRARFYAKEIESLGITVRVEADNYSTFSDKVNHAKVQFYDWGWVADYPDSEDFLMLLAGPNGPNPNNTQYDNPEYNRLFDQVRGMDDGPERAALIHKMRDIEVQDCPIIFVSEDEAPSLFQPWLRNAYSNPIINDTANYRGIDVDQRLESQKELNRPVVTPVLIGLAIFVAAVFPAFGTLRNRQTRRTLKPANEERVAK